MMFMFLSKFGVSDQVEGWQEKVWGLDRRNWAADSLTQGEKGRGCVAKQNAKKKTRIGKCAADVDQLSKLGAAVPPV